MTVYLNRSKPVKLFFTFTRSGTPGTPPSAPHLSRSNRGHLYLPRRWLLLFHRDRRDLNSGVVDQGRGLDGRAGRLGVRHNTLINLVHLGELMNVGEVDRYTDHILQFEASGLDDLLDI